MDKKNINVTYEPLSDANFEQIRDMQLKIFPQSSFERGFDLFKEKGPGVFGHIIETYYLAFLDGEPCGMYGLYIPEGVEEHNSIWLAWYGILPSFRGKGVGKKILSDAMEKAKEYIGKYPLKYFRIYTSLRANPSAQPLYSSFMALREYYSNEEMACEFLMKKARSHFPGKTEEEYKAMCMTEIAVYSKSLDEKEILTPWGNRFMDLINYFALETDHTREDA